MFAPFSRAGQLARGQFWRLFGISLLAALVAGLVGQVVAIPFAILGFVCVFLLPGGWGLAGDAAVDHISTVLTGAIVGPFSGRGDGAAVLRPAVPQGGARHPAAAAVAPARATLIVLLSMVPGALVSRPRHGAALAERGALPSGVPAVVGRALPRWLKTCWTRLSTLRTRRARPGRRPRAAGTAGRRGRAGALATARQPDLAARPDAAVLRDTAVRRRAPRVVRTSRLTQEQWAEAVVESIRALASGLVERGLVVEQSGVTVHEISRGRRAFPSQRPGSRSGASLRRDAVRRSTGRRAAGPCGDGARGASWARPPRGVRRAGTGQSRCPGDPALPRKLRTPIVAPRPAPHRSRRCSSSWSCSRS